MGHRSTVAARLRALALALLIPVIPALAHAAASQQILDRVYAFDRNEVLGMAFGNAYRPPDFTNLGLHGSFLNGCAANTAGGLYCLDGNLVVNWPNALQPGQRNELFSCYDPGIGLDARKGETCTAMTVNQAGAIWIAVRKSSAHSILKVIAKGSACPDAGWTEIGTGKFCAKVFYTGRPPVVDLIPVDGDIAANFRPCAGCAPQAGVLGVEERKNVVFFPDPQGAASVPLVMQGDWGFKPLELLQDVTLVQLPGTGGQLETTVLASTTWGRVLARGTTQAGAVREVFNLPAARKLRSPAPKICNFLPMQFSMRASRTSGIVYVGDRNFCEVIALQPTSNAVTALSYVLDNGKPLILSTREVVPAARSWLENLLNDFAIVGLVIAPGNAVDLSNCTVSCAIINAPGGVPAAQLTGVQVAQGSPTGVTVFQMRGIPDCRYAAKPEFPVDKRALCDTTPNVVIDPYGIAVDVKPDGKLNSKYPPAAMRLNVTPLLPDDVVLAFNASGLRTGGLPSMLISRHFRAQARTNYVFEAMFVLPQPGIRYVNTFNGEFDVPALEGRVSSLGCTPGIGNLIQWDVSTIVSELYVGTGGQHADTLSNIGCGSIRVGAERMSVLPYDLQINPDTWAPTERSSRAQLTEGNDAVFGRLVQSLYDELGYVQRELACKPVDVGSGAAPITDCASLASTWSYGKIKIDTCMKLSFKPASWTRDQYCQYFVEQLLAFRNALPESTPSQDIANRVGELKVRVEVLLHVFNTRFLPSQRPKGFCREDCADGSCGDPWVMTSN